MTLARTFEPSTTEVQRFGESVLIASLGLNGRPSVVVGAPLATGGGKVMLFGTTVTDPFELVISSPATGAQFGASLGAGTMNTVELSGGLALPVTMELYIGAPALTVPFLGKSGAIYGYDIDDTTLQATLRSDTVLGPSSGSFWE